MAFISRLINKRISNLISKFNVPNVLPQVIEKIIIDNVQVEKEPITDN